jgi:CheY-like chemotaxis protein
MNRTEKGLRREGQPMAQGSILVVDDDPDIRETMRLVLTRSDYEVRTARNGSEALKVLNHFQPDLVIMDMMMDTDTEGLDVAGVLRKDPRWQDVPIIMLTCFLEKVRSEGPEKFQKILGEDWPADWLFEKPVDHAKLLAKIERIIAEGK